MGDAKTLVTRGAMERVLARAAELQAAGGDSAESDALSEAQLIELGKEVGLSPEHLRQALAEERARGEPVPDESAGLASLFGGHQVAAQRVVRGRPDDVMAALDRSMQQEEWFRVLRHQPERRVWEPRRDLLGGLRRAFGGRSMSLHSSTSVAATVAAVDADRTLVALVADLSGARRAALGQVVAGTAFGAAASGALALLGFMAVVAVAPILMLTLGSVYGSRRGLAGSLQRAHVALEAVLDRLEQRNPDARPPSLLQIIDSALPRLR